MRGLTLSPAYIRQADYWFRRQRFAGSGGFEAPRGPDNTVPFQFRRVEFYESLSAHGQALASPLDWDADTEDYVADSEADHRITVQDFAGQSFSAGDRAWVIKPTDIPIDPTGDVWEPIGGTGGTTIALWIEGLTPTGSDSWTGCTITRFFQGSDPEDVYTTGVGGTLPVSSPIITPIRNKKFQAVWDDVNSTYRVVQREC